MHATFEYNIHNNQQDKAFHSKMWRIGSYPGRVLLDMTSRFESSMQLMSIEKQYPSQITVAIIAESWDSSLHEVVSSNDGKALYVTAENKAVTRSLLLICRQIQSRP
jgi:hypothetical protein